MAGNLSLPENLPIADLSKFGFGDPDASDDPLLKDCFCTPSWLSKFTSGNYSLVRGHKGSGKTALFEAFKSDATKFNDAKSGDIRIFIDQEFDYQELRQRVIPQLTSKRNKTSFKYRLIWELFVLYYIAINILDNDDLPDELSSILKSLLDHLGRNSSSSGFFKILLGGKKRIGIKVEPNSVGMIGVDAYFDIDESDVIISKNISDFIVNISLVKQLISDYMRQREGCLSIMIDKLDDFVTGENYKTQKAALNGLLLVERDYKKMANMRLTLLFRADLFSELNLEEIGADKAIFRSLDIKWSHEDLIIFSGRRIANNFFKIMDPSHLFLKMSPEQIYENAAGKGLSYWWNHFRSKMVFRNKMFRHGIVRIKNLKTGVFELFVSALLGDKVSHFNLDGSSGLMPFKEFVESHLSFACGNSTPRLILMFLNMAMEDAIIYYHNNPDFRKISFPIIPHNCSLSAYGRLKEKVWEIVAHSVGDFREAAIKLSESKPDKTLSFSDIQRRCVLTESETDRFATIIESLDVIRCINPKSEIYERLYEMPYLYRII